MATRWIIRQGSKPAGFHYTDAAGRAVRDKRALARIDALRIPPAWQDVHIAPSPTSAVQAWGIDAKGRKQYRYHTKAVERGDRRKYYRVRQMARDLPRIRQTLLRDFHRGDFSREHVAATVVRLLSEGFFRVGGDRSAKENRTFGLTTLRKTHVAVAADAITFEYAGKGGIRQWKVVTDRALARVVAALQNVPGSRLFRYEGAGGWTDLTARDVNDYVREITGRRYTAKDFRTWGGTLRFATVLAELGAPESETARRRAVVMAVRLVAAELGNTPAICRKSYVHPIVIARYLDEGETIAPRQAAGAQRRRGSARAPEERALIRFLDRHFPERRRRRRSEIRGDIPAVRVRRENSPQPARPRA
ncbi:MAG: DNA topoisomerase IB [Gemmatimonadota bacterium]|nr:DNA topoisomerase IB [Gemmatimonadota bacterium]